MNALAERIRSRGYWETAIRPVVPRKDRIPDLTQMPFVLDRIAIAIRGWSFPHVNLNRQLEREQEVIGQDTEWKYFFELWRVFKSGQFFHLAGMRHDWGAQRSMGIGEEVPANAPTVGMGDALYRLSEMTLFAGNYVRNVLDGEASELRMRVGGLKGRYMVVDDPGRFGFASEAIATTESPFSASVIVDGATTQEMLLGIARKEAKSLFELFGRSVAEPVLEEWQKQVRAY